MQSKTKILSRNILFALIFQFVNLISGLIVPRIILAYFGSEVNGLIYSVSQFLSYVTLLEGGLSGVIMAGLYKPLQAHDDRALSGIINASRRFFRTIALIYLAYVLAVSLLYPLFVETPFSYRYTLALIWVLAANLFTQYFFSLSFRLLIQADQKEYFVSAVSSLVLILNTAATVLVAKLYPDILLLRLVNALVFLIQPIAFAHFVRRHYHLDDSAEADEKALAQRWDGFWQNIAYFIHSNTDIVVLTLFASLSDVSVYGVYMLVINALRTLILAISNAVVPTFGNTLAAGDKAQTDKEFDAYEFAIFIVTTFLFACGASLIVPFVSVYTKGVMDADYHQPLFAVLMLLAEAVYCLRDPYVSAPFVAGHFRQTRAYAAWEAIINIAISLTLVHRLGLVGVAAGTLAAMLFRLIAHVVYLQDAILYRDVKKALRMLLLSFAIIFTVFFITRQWLRADVADYLQWTIQAIKVSLITASLIGIAAAAFYRDQFKAICGKFRRKTGGGE